MARTSNIFARLEPGIKEQAEEVLDQLGIPMSTAVNMYLNQIALMGGIPFAVTLPKAPPSVDADRMTARELHAKLQGGLEDVENGRVHDAEQAFSAFREKR